MKEEEERGRRSEGERRHERRQAFVGRKRDEQASDQRDERWLGEDGERRRSQEDGRRCARASEEVCHDCLNDYVRASDQASTVQQISQGAKNNKKRRGGKKGLIKGNAILGSKDQRHCEDLQRQVRRKKVQSLQETCNRLICDDHVSFSNTKGKLKEARHQNGEE